MYKNVFETSSFAIFLHKNDLLKKLIYTRHNVLR